MRQLIKDDVLANMRRIWDSWTPEMRQNVVDGTKQRLEVFENHVNEIQLALIAGEGFEAWAWQEEHAAFMHMLNSFTIEAIRQCNGSELSPAGNMNP